MVHRSTLFRRRKRPLELLLTDCNKHATISEV